MDVGRKRESGMRCFVGVPVDGALAQACLALSDGIPRAIPAPNLHLTLAFLGNIEGERVSRISEWLAAQLQYHRAFDITPTNCEPFPGRQGPFLALTINPTPAPLLLLYQALLPGLPEADSRRPYSPHITLAKPGYGVPVRTGHWTLTVDRVCLYHSVMSAAGPPRYHALKTCPLRSG